MSRKTLQDFASEKTRLQEEELLHIEKCTECGLLFYNIMKEASGDSTSAAGS